MLIELNYSRANRILRKQLNIDFNQQIDGWSMNFIKRKTIENKNINEYSIGQRDFVKDSFISTIKGNVKIIESFSFLSNRNDIFFKKIQSMKRRFSLSINWSDDFSFENQVMLSHSCWVIFSCLVIIQLMINCCFVVWKAKEILRSSIQSDVFLLKELLKAQDENMQRRAILFLVGFIVEIWFSLFPQEKKSHCTECSLVFSSWLIYRNEFELSE